MTDEQDFEVKAEESFNLGTQLYMNDSGSGDLLNRFLKTLTDTNSNVCNVMVSELQALDPNLNQRSNYMQKVTINRVLLKYLFTITATTHADINNQISLCNNNHQDEIWLGSVKTSVLPLLLNYIEF